MRMYRAELTEDQYKKLKEVESENWKGIMTMNEGNAIDLCGKTAHQLDSIKWVADEELFFDDIIDL